MKRMAIQCLAPALLLLCWTPGFAATVYKSVDENGVVSFSDTPPAGGIEAETLKIVTPQPQSPDEYEDRLEDMRETTDRMSADRREREKHRAEMRELQARTESQQQQQQEQPYYAYDDYYPLYNSGYNTRNIRRRYNGRPPWRPGFRPKPAHPIARAPMRPGSNVNLGSNSQLMRPIVSPRR